MVRNRIAESDAASGFLLDGYPRTLVQIDDELDRMINVDGHSLDAVVLLVIDQGEIIQRLLRRASIEGRADDNEP